MNKDKIDEKVKITVVHQHDVSNDHSTEHPRDADKSWKKITVVDETFSTYLQEKWLTLMKSPLFFVASLILALAIGYLSGWIDQRDAKVSPDNTASGNKGSAEYGQQPLGSQARAKHYARLANHELREESLDFTLDLRKFLLNMGVEENETALSLMAGMSARSAEAERQRVWQDYVSASGRVLEARILEYENEFRPQAILLRNELLSRLPDLRRNESADSFYEKTDNPVDIRQVLDDLTLLTEALLAP